MTKNTEFGSQLIINAREKGDRASVSALFEYYRKSFETAAMVHFKQFPFDREVAWLPNRDKRKQRVVINAAYEGFVEAYLTYDPSMGTKFETWLSKKIWSHFGNLYEKSSKINKRELRYGEDGEIFEDICVKYKNKKYELQCGIDNGGYGTRNIHNACDTDMVNAVLKSMPEKSSARKNAEMLYQIFSEEGAGKQSSAADRLGISRQAVNKSFKSYREYGPKYLRDRVLETLRLSETQNLYATKTPKRSGSCV